MAENNIRIYFNLDQDDWHGHATEGVWGEPIETSSSGTLYRLVNSPFFVQGVSYMDVIRATPRIDGGPGLNFAEVIDKSGHSTYMILVSPNSKEFDLFWKRLEVLGCSYEWTSIDLSIGTQHLYAVDVPDSTDVDQVRSVLGDGQTKNVWMFQEGHCGHPTEQNKLRKSS